MLLHGSIFSFDGHKAKAQLEASVTVPSLNYSWKSEALEKSTADFAILGQEANREVLYSMKPHFSRAFYGTVSSPAE